MATPEYKEIMRKMEQLPPDNGWTSINPHTPESVASEIYRRSAGEAEARAVQARRDLTPEQRQSRAPWLDYDVPEGQQIVRFDNEGSQMSAGSNPRNVDPLGYYSTATEAALRLAQNKGTPEQMMAQLKKNGAKDAEIQATGLDQILSGNKPVTKDDILRILREIELG